MILTIRLYNPGRQIASQYNPDIKDEDCEYRLIMDIGQHHDIQMLCHYIKCLLQEHLPESWEHIHVNYSKHLRRKTCMGAKYKDMDFAEFWKRITHWRDYNFYYYGRTGRTEPKILFHKDLPIENISSIPVFP